MWIPRQAVIKSGSHFFGRYRLVQCVKGMMCAGARPLGNLDVTIEHYSSEDGAIDNGWARTRNPEYCPIGVDWAYICPDCMRVMD